MGQAIGEMLPFAFGIALSPMSIIAVVLILATPEARANGLSFLLGWIVGIAAAGAIVLAVVGPSDPTDQDGPAAWVSWLKLAIGALLLLVAVRAWTARPASDEEVDMPKWMGALDDITPVKAGGMAVLVGAINPKCLLFIVGGATAVAQTGISAGEQAIAWTVFTVIATIGVGTPILISISMGDRATRPLDRVKTWMAHNNTAIMAVLCGIIGVKLIGDAISGFSS